VSIHTASRISCVASFIGLVSGFRVMVRISRVGLGLGLGLELAS